MGKKTYKTYHRFTFASFFTGLLCFAFFAVFALFLFMPAINVGGTEYTGLQVFLTGLNGKLPTGDFTLKSLLTFLPAEWMDAIETAPLETSEIASIFETGKSENIVFSILAPFHGILEIAYSVLFSLSILVGAVVAILGLFWIVTGRLLAPKASLIVARFSHTLLDLGIGVFFFYCFLLNDLAGASTEVMMTMFPWVCFGAQIACTILMHITWRLSYRHREFDPHRKGYEEKQEKKERAKNEATMVPVYEKDVVAKGGNIADHAYANDATLTKGNIPAGVTSIGSNAFANCRNLESVTIPQTVERIGANCFSNTPNLKQITYLGTKEDWRQIKRGGNWLVGAGTTTIVCKDGAIVVNPNS